MVLKPIELADVDKRLDVFMAERADLTRSASQKLLKDGLVKVNGKVISKNYKLRENDIVEFDLPELAEEKNTEEQIKMCFEAYRLGDKWKTVFEYLSFQ